MRPRGQALALHELVAALMHDREVAPTPHLEANLIRRHLLGPLAHARGLRGFRDEYLASDIETEFRLEQLREVVQCFGQASLPVAAIKGMAAAWSLYDAPALRPMVDIDLLVRPHDFERAGRALLALGYHQSRRGRERSGRSHAVTYFRDGVPLDLHRSIVQPLRARMDLDAIWARVRPAAAPIANLLELEAVDALLFQLLHIARHELLVPAIGYLDAGRMLERLSPSQRRELGARARAARVGRAVASALAMTDALGRRTPPRRSLRTMLLPGVAEVLCGPPPPRTLQLLRKCFLTEGPRELFGLATVQVAEVAASRAYERGRRAAKIATAAKPAREATGVASRKSSERL